MQYDLYAYVKGAASSATKSKTSACDDGAVALPTSVATNVFGAWLNNHRKDTSVTPEPLKGCSTECPANPPDTTTPEKRYQQLQKHLCEYADLSVAVPAALEAL
ncbi:uncharacterized protein TEOVI_000283000 [Trypanosoma equiperdum]|uniref:Trypanosomal VSG domain containing protein n=1 Tax=Trypanosoma equiperdum TaxID=5694 RepID=A0A1G4IFY7_TRYEQ|nr:hypothetical protein TEOVI_000283000 [Trypanosoma equiperdum]